MSADPVKGYPIPSIRRLPLYLRYLRTIHSKGQDVVSCTHIANDLGLISVQVRKDLAITGAAGRPKVGYAVDDLISSIEHFLGWDNTNDAFLVGAGSLGSAIMGYDAFADDGLNIVAAFDTDPDKVGRRVHGREVFPLDKLEELAHRMHILIGILTVPARAAQTTAELLVGAGVRALWNYTPVRLEIPDGVVCEDVRLSSSLAVLSSRLKSVLEESKASAGST